MPAFRAQQRCEVYALAGTNLARVAELAHEANVPRAYGDWRALIDDPAVDAVSIATPPSVQAQIAIHALELGTPVFAEKPMASTLAEARAMLRSAERSTTPAMVDFSFHQILSWQRAKTMIDEGAIGALRHVVVNWHVETAATRKRIRNWKTMNCDGGGVLGNFVSHCFHYLEWFCGPTARLTARLSGPAGDSNLQTTAAIMLEFAAGQIASLSVSCASYLGSGHRIEFYGEDGALVLHNPGPDYMRGFELFCAKRPMAAMDRITMEDPLDTKYADGRIVPLLRLSSRFLDAIEAEGPTYPGFAEGYRVQGLLDAAQRSHRDSSTVDVDLQNNSAAPTQSE